MIDAIIGREHGTNRLLLTVNNKAYAISQPNSVPKTVSSKHCRLLIDDKGQMTLTNLKDQLCTYVNGIAISRKIISMDSLIELGEDRFHVDMNTLKKAVDALLPPPTFSLKPLEKVWEDYQNANEEIVIKEQQRSNVRNLQGVFMTLGVVVLLLPEFLHKSQYGEIPSFVNVMRFILSIPAIVIPIYFYLRGRNASKSLYYQQNVLKKDFETKYVCPNPKCRRFMGYIPYNTLKFSQRCTNPECACQYTNK